MSAMRSVDDRLIFKLALSPYSSDLSELMSSMAAMPGHDHEEIWLTYGRKAEAMRFSFALMQQSVAERFGREIALDELFGNAVLPQGLEGEFVRSRPIEEAQARYVRALYAADASFARYVDRTVGGLKALLTSRDTARSQYLRKVLPLVIVRSEFRAADRAMRAGGMRSRKNSHIYTGTAALATVLEGNPRWIIGVMTELLSVEGEKVAPNRQAAEIVKTRNRFRALLTTIPVSEDSQVTRKGLVHLIDRIGASFRYSAIQDDFNPDPVGTFVVDKDAGDELVSALGSAINAGAIVYVPDLNSAGLLTSVRGKRFRLSYLLATQYGLPLRLQRAASLRSVLAGEAPTTTLEMFDEE